VALRSTETLRGVVAPSTRPWALLLQALLSSTFVRHPCNLAARLPRCLCPPILGRTRRRRAPPSSIQSRGGCSWPRRTSSERHRSCDCIPSTCWIH